ncbi:MAG: DNA-3-methyladenine glycosylase 2 family protein [Methylotenera sp.]
MSAPQSHALAKQFLSEIDADWAQLIRTVGACTFNAETEPTLNIYESLVQAVAYQQLHGKAGDAIFARFKNLFNGFPQPEQLISAQFDDLRACGFSARKIETIQGIANGAVTGIVPSRQAAENMSDAELSARLVTLKGIGQWTVEMMLMFTLKRMDILPADDFAVVEGYKRLKKLEITPKRKEIAEIGKAWSPHRTIASWYLWRVPK